MTSKKRDFGWLIPEVIAPPTTKCVRFNIPDDQRHIAAFWGAVTELAAWFNWEKTGDDSGAQCANVWKQVIAESRDAFILGDCGVDCDDCLDNVAVRVDNTTGSIDISRDGGATFEPTGQTTVIYNTANFNDFVTDVDRRCNTAANLFVWLMDKYGDQLDLIDFYVSAVASSDAIIAIFLPLYVLVDQVMDAATEIVGATVAAARAEDTIDRRDAARCWFFCNLPDNGELTEQVWQDFIIYMDEWSGSVSAPGVACLIKYLNQFTFDAVFAEARRWSYETGACGDCDCPETWSYTWDFAQAESALGWVGISPNYPTVIPTALGLESTVYLDTNADPDVSRRWVYIKKMLSFPDATTRVQNMRFFYVNASAGSGSTEGAQSLQISPRIRENETANIESAGNTDFAAGDGEVLAIFPGEVEILSTYYALAAIKFAQRNSDIGQPVDGTGYLAKVIISGIGKNPFIE